MSRPKASQAVRLPAFYCNTPRTKIRAAQGRCTIMSPEGFPLHGMSKDDAEIIVSALNDGDASAIRKWLRSRNGKLISLQFREAISARLSEVT